MLDGVNLELGSGELFGLEGEFLCYFFFIMCFAP